LASGAELNPAVIYKLPDQIAWRKPDDRGVQTTVMVGDPSKPGLYAVLTKWLKGNHFSRPHFHPNDRYITVLSGTWWVGSGPKFDPDQNRAEALSAKRVNVIAPPGRKSHARDLKPLFEITAGRLAKCLLPETATGRDGAVLFKRPASYTPPKAPGNNP
jgi:hypothetical protein